MNVSLQRAIELPGFRSGSWLLGVPAVLYALSVLPFVYQGVVGEPDLERMTLGVIYGASTGLHATANFHYGYLVSFGYYAALYHLLPTSILLNSAALIPVINYLGYASAVAALCTLALYTARLFGVRAAFATCMIFGFSPLFLDIGTSGHPQIPGMALLLLGAWLLTFATEEEVRVGYRAAATSAALAVMITALCVRNDVALVFPFITIASPAREGFSTRAWLRASGLRLAVLAVAVVIYVVIESHVYHDHGDNADFVATFFATFYNPRTVPRGLAAFVLSTGIASILCLAALLASRAVRRLPRLDLAAIALLALPTLLFWLPNPTPPRHLLAAVLAVAMFIALVLGRLARPQYVVALGILLPIGNQALAEASHGFLVSHYRWPYPQLTLRRVSTSIPTGAFPLDHDAKQEDFTFFRNEGRAFARACSGHLLVFAPRPHYMMLSLIELDRSVRLNSTHVGDAEVVRASGLRCTADFVLNPSEVHGDTLREFLDRDAYKGLPIYFQEARRDQYDRTAVPAARRFCIDSVPGRICPRASPLPDSRPQG
jgi:hypothetical protein